MEWSKNGFGWSEIRRLLKKGEGPHVSIYLPFHDEWTDRGADSKRLSHVLTDVKKKLRDGGLRPAEADALLEPVRQLTGDEPFLREGARGASIFVAEGIFQVFHLSVDVDELVTVSGQFHTRPLMKQLSTDGRFFILALSRQQVRLFEAERHHISELKLEDTPLSLDESMKFDEFERHSSVHSGSSGTTQDGIHHGGGGAADHSNIKAHLKRFLQGIDSVVQDHLAGESTPLVLVGLDELRGLYRDANHYRYLLDEDVNHNPDGVEAERLHELVWPLVEPGFRKAAQEAREQFQRLAALAPERIARKAKHVAEAAFVRRVDTLILPETGRVWGTIDPETGDARTVSDPTPRIDLLDYAAGQTLLGGGRIFTVASENIPGEGDVAAILRY